MFTLLFSGSLHLLIIAFYNFFKQRDLAYNMFGMFFIVFFLVSTSSSCLSLLSPLRFFMDFVLDRRLGFALTCACLALQCCLWGLVLFFQQRHAFAPISSSLEPEASFDFANDLSDSKESEICFADSQGASSRALLKLDNVSFTYSPSRPFALQRVSLSLSKGQVVCLAGRNGSGKSTLVKLLLGLISPSRGHVVAAPSHRAASLVPQNNVLFEYLTVDEALGFFLAILGRERSAEVAALTGRLGLDEYLRTRVKKLSKGNQRKLAILLALLRQPDLLILDEPTNNLGWDSV